MNYRNAKHISEGRIDCEIEHPVHGWIPYTLDPADTDTTVDNDELLLAIGADAVAYVPPTQEELDVALAAEVREKRDGLLLEVDAYVSNPLRWAGLDTDTQSTWATYRQALLDVPQQEGFPSEVTWSVAPQ
tara:strand:- start:75 stop:467 length:393 start_codon:yes stop_codon:yes gene_type:complete